MWGHTGAPMLHVGISYSLKKKKKKRLFIVDYIKPSPVYQVKCKLVISIITKYVLETIIPTKVGIYVKYSKYLICTDGRLCAYMCHI